MTWFSSGLRKVIIKPHRPALVFVLAVALASCTDVESLEESIIGTWESKSGNDRWWCVSFSPDGEFAFSSLEMLDASVTPEISPAAAFLRIGRGNEWFAAAGNRVVLEYLREEEGGYEVVNRSDSEMPPVSRVKLDVRYIVDFEGADKVALTVENRLERGKKWLNLEKVDQCSEVFSPDFES